MMSGFGGGNDPALADARKARRTADNSAKDRLMDLLTEDQKQLPSEDSLREDPWQAMAGGDEDEE